MSIEQLHERLERDAEAEGLLDVAYRTLDTAVGRLLLAATPRGLVRVGYDVQGEDAVLTDLATRVSPRVLRAPRRLDPVARELEEYFAGTRRAFDLPLDLSLAHGFRREVVEQLTSIGYGSTASYGELATTTGRPRAVRAVGTACALNPLPLVLPCHRVVRSDGSMGRYAGGEDRKRFLLDLEAG